MTLTIQSGRTIYGGSYQYINAGLVKGRNWLRAQGFAQCPNPLYMSRGAEHYHYNGTMRMWVNL